MNKKFIAVLMVLLVAVGMSPVLAAPEQAPAKVKDWEGAFERKTVESFMDALAEDVVLEGAAVYKPMVGRDKVALSMATASNSYKYCNFVTRVVSGNKTFLEWELETIEGDLRMKGNTIITRNEAGKIAHLVINHRPTGKMLQFTALMAKNAPELVEYFTPQPGNFAY